MSRRRRKKSTPPLLIPRLPQVPVLLPPLQTFFAPVITFIKFLTLGGFRHRIPPPLLKFESSCLHMGSIAGFFGSGYSRRFFSQAGFCLRELHSFLLRPTFLSGLSTSRTAPNTARPPPTAPGPTFNISCRHEEPSINQLGI